MTLKARDKFKCVVKFLLKTSNNFEAVIGLEIDMGVRFLLKSSRSHSSQQAKLTADCVWHSSRIGNCVSYYDSNTWHNCNFML